MNARSNFLPLVVAACFATSSCDNVGTSEQSQPPQRATPQSGQPNTSQLVSDASSAELRAQKAEAETRRMMAELQRERMEVATSSLPLDAYKLTGEADPDSMITHFQRRYGVKDPAGTKVIVDVIQANAQGGSIRAAELCKAFRDTRLTTAVSSSPVRGGLTGSLNAVHAALGAQCSQL